MSRSLSILIVEDSDSDANLLKRTLISGGFEVTCEVVDTPEAMKSALYSQQKWDLITSDHSMPFFSAPEALDLAKKIQPNTPFIIVSGEIDINLAVNLMRNGAQDYVQKKEMARIIPVIERELKEAQLHQGQKHTLTALTASEERLREVLENSLDASYKRNIRTNQYEFLSPVINNITGYSVEEMISFSLEEVLNLFHPDDLPEINRTINESLSGKKGDSYNLEYRFKHKAGHYLWLQDKFKVIDDENGNPYAFIGSVSDISKRKKIERELVEAKSRLENIIEGTRAGSWEWNIETGETVFNETWAQIVGYTLEELSPTSIKIWEGLTHPEDLKKSDIELRKHFSGENPYYDIECRMKHKNGNWIWVHDRGKITSWTKDGKPLMMMGSHQDITERKIANMELKQSEEQFRTLTSLAPVGIYLTNPDGTCLYTNRTWQAMAGLSNEEALGDGWVNGIHPDDRELVLKNWQKMVESSGEWGCEYRILDRKGKTATVFGIATAQKDDNGNIVGYIGVNIDITERKQSEMFTKNLITMNPVAIQVLDKEGFTLEVNPAFKSLFGSVPPSDYSIFTDPQLKQKGLGDIFNQLLNGEVVHFPDVSFNPHDSIESMPDIHNWIRTIGFPLFSDNNKPERFVLMQENITERRNAEVTLRESEFRFRQVFDLSPVGIVMVSLEKRFINSNLAFSQSLGYETNELVGRLIEEVTFPDDRNIGMQEMRSILNGEATSSQVFKRYLRKDGEIIWGELTISLIRDANGIPQYFLALIQNVTERKKSETKINEQLNELKRWHKITLGREDRILELKHEVNQQLLEAGKPPKYNSIE